MHPRAAADNAYVADLERQEDELATQIRHASRDIHGRKDVYDLTGKSIEELEDILYDLGNSPEQRDIDDMYRDKEEDAMGRDLDLSPAEMAPQRQGMRRRSKGSKSQRRMESKKKITKKQLKKMIQEETARVVKEMHPRAAADDALMEVIEATDELYSALSKTNLGVEALSDDELYIMTGAAEGITVKILRRGR